MNFLDAVRGFANGGVPLTHFMALSGLMFLIGLYGVLTRQNLVAILMSVEILLNACMLNFVAIAAYTDPVGVSGGSQGNVFALFIVAMAAAEVGVGLAIFLNVFRAKGGITPDDLREMHS